MEKEILNQIKKELEDLAKSYEHGFFENKFITVPSIMLGSSTNVVQIIHPFVGCNVTNNFKVPIEKIFLKHGFILGDWVESRNNRIVSEAKYQLENKEIM